MVSYRVLRRTDVAEVQSVARKAWKYAYRKYLSPATIRRFVSERYSTSSFEKFVFPSMERGDSQFYLATYMGKIIGYSNVGRGEWGWELYRIYLLPEYIGKGVGRKLPHLAESFLRQKKVKNYHLYVYVNNELGIELYLRNGFVRLKGKDKNYAEVCFQKKLTGPASRQDHSNP